ncbi:MAG: agmatine deiminase family protein, partial [Hyphomonadaceae bacterium]
PVRLACGSDEAEESARAALGNLVNLTYARIPTGDIWLRDTGPIIGARDGEPHASCFNFNGWGGKYVMPGDTETARAMANFESIPVTDHGFILEGGAIELDGAGRLLTTRQCLLNSNRNGWSEAEAEAALKAAFNISEIIWLERGLSGDHTDGHIDNIARFIAPGHALCQQASGDTDPHAERLAEIEAALRASGLEVSCLPSPGRITGADGEMLPASHLNFTLTNGALMMPAFEGHYSARAMMALAELFPGYDVIALPSNHILEGGGSFHCMTREIPLIGADPS